MGVHPQLSTLLAAFGFERTSWPVFLVRAIRPNASPFTLGNDRFASLIELGTLILGLIFFRQPPIVARQLSQFFIAEVFEMLRPAFKRRCYFFVRHTCKTVHISAHCP